MCPRYGTAAMTYNVEYMNALRSWAAANGSSVPPEVTAALEQHEAAEQERLRAAGPLSVHTTRHVFALNLRLGPR